MRTVVATGKEGEPVARLRRIRAGHL
jgi:hypothetical protein